MAAPLDLFIGTTLGMLIAAQIHLNVQDAIYADARSCCIRVTFDAYIAAISVIRDSSHALYVRASARHMRRCVSIPVQAPR